MDADTLPKALVRLKPSSLLAVVSRRYKWVRGAFALLLV